MSGCVIDDYLPSQLRGCDDEKEHSGFYDPFRQVLIKTDRFLMYYTVGLDYFVRY